MTNLKDMLPVFPWDKLSHYQWASWFSACAAMLGLFTAALWHPLAISALIGAAASIGTAYAAGKLGEMSDEKANKAAAARGEPLPHEVSQADIKASFLGCAPSALPLLCVALVAALSYSK